MVSQQVSFIGLGAMGLGLATNLHKHLHDQGSALHVWNRTASKARPLLDAGAQPLGAPAEAAQGEGSTTFSMLYDDAALRDNLEQFLKSRSAKGSTYVSCSTVSASLVKDLAAKAQEAGVIFVSAPVFGRPDAAMEHRVTFAVAGPAKTKEQLQPLLKSMSRGILDLGEQPELANVMKITGNFMIASWIEILGEGMALAERNGVSRDQVAAYMKNAFIPAIAPGYVDRINAQTFEIGPDSPGFPVAGGLKDVGLMQDLAKQSGASLPTADTMSRNLRKAEQDGLGDKDWGSMALVLRQEAGLE